MGKGIHLFLFIDLPHSNIFPRRNDGNSIYTYRILMECLRNKDPQYMTTFLIPNWGKYWLRGDCLIHGQSPLSLFLSILDNRFLIYILSFLRLSCRIIVIQNQPQEFFSRLTLCTTFFCRDMVTMALYRYHAITAIGTACIAANGTKISVLLSSKWREFHPPFSRNHAWQPPITRLFALNSFVHKFIFFINLDVDRVQIPLPRVKTHFCCVPHTPQAIHTLC